MGKMQKIIIGILVCILTIGVGGGILYQYNDGFRNSINQLFNIKNSNIDYDNDEYVLSLRAEIDRLKSTISQYEKEDLILKNRITELENRVAVLEEKVANLQKQKEELNTQIDDLKLEVEEIWALLFD